MIALNRTRDGFAQTNGGPADLVGDLEAAWRRACDADAEIGGTSFRAALLRSQGLDPRRVGLVMEDDETPLCGKEG